MADNKKSNMTFVQKLENYWYHYKWHTIIGAFFLAVAVVCTVQCAQRSEADAMIMYAGNYKVAEEYRENSLESIMKEDYNGDGKKRADVFQLIIPITETQNGFELDDPIAQTNNTEFQRLYTEVANGTSVIYILHPLLYEQVKSMDVLRPLSEIFEKVPEYAVDEYGVPISELVSYMRTTLRFYPENSIVCIRRRRTKGDVMQADNNDYYENNVKFFKDIIEY